jgi:hypothetical protein
MKRNLLPIKITLLSLIVSCVAASSVSAQCWLQPITLQERLANSTLVIEGKVVQQYCQRDIADANIFTVSKVKVFSIIKGAIATDTISIVNLGGRLGMQAQVTTNTLELQSGDVGLFTLVPTIHSFTSNSPIYDAYAGPQGFIKYNEVDKKAIGVFDEYNNYDIALTDSVAKYVSVVKVNKAPISFSKVGLNATNVFQISQSQNLQGGNSSSLPNGGGGASYLTSGGSITSLSPTTINAGVNDTLTINGTGFGATQTGNSIEFRNNNFTTTAYSTVLDYTIISWSNTQIKVLVPSFAGTGRVRVTDGTNTFTSPVDLTVTYAITNFTSNAGGSDAYYKAAHINDNINGGYSFQYSASNFTVTAAQTYFETALNDWRCATGINWDVTPSNTTTVTTVSQDAVNIVTFDNASSLAAGTLGQATSRYSGCISGSNIQWYISEIDINCNDVPGSGFTWYYGTGSVASNQYDFYSMIIHELGHAQQLSHVLQTSDFMYPSIANGTFNRTISAGNDSGGTYFVNYSKTTSQCAQSLHKEYTCTPSVTLTVSNNSPTEASGTLTVTATSSGVNASAVTVTIAATGTASGSGTDYTLGSTTITIPAWSTSGTTTISLVNDALYENSETIILDITAVTNGTENGVQQQTITITDNDAQPTVTLSTGASSITEGGSATTVIATLSAASGLSTTVNLAYSGTATSGTDYTQVTSLVIPAGSTTVSASLPSIDDAIYEGTETIIIDINSVTNAVENGVQQNTITLNDNEAPPSVSLSISSTNILEAAGVATITATLNTAVAQNVVVELSTTGVANSASDYNLGTYTLTIAAGSTVATTTITALQDALYEGNESVILDITNVTGAQENGTQQQIISITDDDAQPSASIAWSNTSIGEASTGTSNAVITLSAASGVTSTFTVAFSNTATLNTDYTITGTTVSIPAGSTSAFVTINNIADVLYEGNEFVEVTITTANNASIGSPSNVIMTINDDDAAPTVSISASPTSITEAAGTGDITVTLSAISGLPTTVILSYSGTASNGIDYNSNTNAIIAAGASSTTVNVTATDDSVFEGNEQIVVNINTVTNGTENGVQTDSFTILENESMPTVSLFFAADTVSESASISNLTAELSGLSALPITVYLSKSGVANSYPSRSDYTLADSIVVNAGQINATTPFTVVDDNFYESFEQAVVNISTVSNAGIAANSADTIVITDNEILPSISISNVASAYNESDPFAEFEITVNTESELPITYSIAVSGDVSANDYTMASTFTLSVGTSQSIQLNINDDLVDENDELATLTISSATNATIGSSSNASTTINDNDAEPTITLGIGNNGNLPENGGANYIWAKLSAPTEKTVVVNLAFSGIATFGDDYTMDSSIIFNNVAIDSIALPITIIDDTLDEDLFEQVIISIASASNASGTSMLSFNVEDNEMPIMDIIIDGDTIADGDTLSYNVQVGQNIVVQPTVNNSGNTALPWAILYSDSTLTNSIANVSDSIVLVNSSVSFTSATDTALCSENGQIKYYRIVVENLSEAITSEIVYKVTVIDTSAPIAPVLADVYFDCSGTLSTIPVGTTLCGATFNATTTDATSFTALGNYSINWTFTNATGQFSTAIQNVIVQDTIAPVADTPSLPIITAACDTTIAAIPTATDVCAGVINATTTDPLTYNVAGTYTITWVYNDNNGNTSVQTQQVTITSGSPTITSVSSAGESLCYGDITALTASGADTYTWSNGVTDAVAFEVFASNTYTVVGTTNVGCTSSATKLIELSSSDLANSSSQNTVINPGQACHVQNILDGQKQYFTDIDCSIYIAIDDSNDNIDLQDVTACVFSEASTPRYNGQLYIPRHYYVTPTNQGAAQITFYFTQQDIDMYNDSALANGQLPIVLNASGQYEFYCTQVPNDSVQFISQGNSILHPFTATYDSVNNFWYGTISVSSFSGFYFHQTNTNSPLNAWNVALQGSIINKCHELNWATKNIEVHTQVLQHSADAKIFTSINTSENAKSFTNCNTSLGDNYYRVQVIDNAGKQYFSNTIKLEASATAGIQVWPNPCTNSVQIAVNNTAKKQSSLTAQLIDATGSIVAEHIAIVGTGINTFSMNTQMLASGTFTVKIICGDSQYYHKLTVAR